MVAITGIMGAGKSTVAQLLAESLTRAVHVRGDLFRRMVVTGRKDMVPGADDEAFSQLRLRYELGATTADAYARGGFTAVYQDVILGSELVEVPGRIKTRPLFLFVLAPRAEVALSRAESRDKVSGYGEWSAEALDALLRETPRIGAWIDTSDQSAEATLEEMRRRAAEARIGLTLEEARDA